MAKSVNPDCWQKLFLSSEVRILKKKWLKFDLFESMQKRNLIIIAII